jgi:hypothetical protein
MLTVQHSPTAKKYTLHESDGVHNKCTSTSSTSFFGSERMENKVIIHGKGLNLQMVCLVDFGSHKNNFNSVYWG